MDEELPQATASAEEGTRADLRYGTIPAMLRAVAADRPDDEAVVDPSGDTTVRLSYRDVLDRSDAVAAAVIAAGVQAGDRVAIWAPNCWEWIVALLGLQSAGAVLVPLNTRYKGVEAADILRRSNARILFTVEGFLGNDYVSMLREPGGDLPDLDTIVLLRGDAPAPTDTSLTDTSLTDTALTDTAPADTAPTDTALADRQLVDDLHTLDEFVRTGASVPAAEVDARVAALSGDDLSDLLFTSGTTGAPKGVQLTHAQTLRAFGDWADIGGLRPQDRYLCINPFFHAFGYKAGIVAAFMTGATLVPMAVFDMDRVVDLIESERISVLPGPPTIYQSLLNHPGFDTSRTTTLRLAVTGAAAVPVELVEQMRDTLGFETVVTAYGMTESCGCATIRRSGDSAETISTTSGRAFPGVEVKVIDDDGNTVEAGTPGEIMVRGYNVTTGYFQAPEQTAEAITADGWLHTGDIGVMDDRGYVTITDRKKDMFIVGGFNAYPAEIERLLLVHPEIAQAAVVGVPDERMGEVGYAFVVPAHGTEPDPAAIVQWARDNMANFKAPRHVALVDALPLNASGKVLKFDLRDRAVADLT